jgi:hypothetical protein
MTSIDIITIYCIITSSCHPLPMPSIVYPYFQPLSEISRLLKLLIFSSAPLLHSLQQMGTRTFRPFSAGLLLLLLIPFACALPSLLIFTKISAGAYTHESIPYAIEVIAKLGQGSITLNDSVADPSLANANAKWTVTHNDDDSIWEDGEYLNQYDAVAFLMTKWVLRSSSTKL